MVYIYIVNMVLVDKNFRKTYCRKIYGKGCAGRRYVLRKQTGSGVVSEISKGVSKSVLGGLGSALGKTLAGNFGKFIENKTGSSFAGKAAKAISGAALSSMGKMAGQQLGSVISKAIVPDNKKKKTTVDELLNQGRVMLQGGDGSGMRAPGIGRGSGMRAPGIGRNMRGSGMQKMY